MSHLGDRLSALLDGQLSGRAEARAWAHLAECRECREAAEAERVAKARLAALAEPRPTGDLVGRLLAMGAPGGPVPPRSGHVPGTPRPRPVRLADSALSLVLPAGLGVSAGLGVPAGIGAFSGIGIGGAPGRRRRRLVGAAAATIGVVGVGVGAAMLMAPSVSAHSGPGSGGASGADLMVIQRPPMSASVTIGRRPVASATPSAREASTWPASPTPSAGRTPAAGRMSSAP